MNHCVCAVFRLIISTYLHRLLSGMKINNEQDASKVWLVCDNV